MKTTIVALMIASLLGLTSLKAGAASVAPTPLTAQETAELLHHEEQSIKELGEVEGEGVGTFIGLFLVAGAIVLLAFAIAGD